MSKSFELNLNFEFAYIKIFATNEIIYIVSDETN